MNNEHFNHDTWINFRIRITDIGDISASYEDTEKGLLITLLENPHYQKMVASPLLLLDSDINQDFFNNKDVS